MADRKDDIFSFAGLDPTRVFEGFRTLASDLAGRGANHSRDAYRDMRAVAEEASRTVEATVGSAQSGTAELGLKAIEALRLGADMSAAHMEALMGARSLSEVFELQASFMRRQAETAIEQARSMQEAARRVAGEVARPGRDAAEKVMANIVGL